MMTEKKTFRLVISIFLCLVFGRVSAQNEYDGKQNKAIDIDKSEYIENQFKANEGHFAKVVPGSCTLFPPRIAVKTNLLYWSGVMPDFRYYSFLPNLEVEWFIKNGWSIAFSGAYSKWGAGKDKFFGVSSWSLEGRYWFWEYRNVDFYGGLYLQAGDFDNQNLHIKEFGNTGTFWGTGLSAGVYIPIKKQWGAEVGFRTGFEHRRTDVYNRESRHYFRDYTGTQNRWRITGIDVSVSYRFWEKTNTKGAK